VIAELLAVVLGFLLFSVAINDLADERIDRINLADDRRRPLLTGLATRCDLIAVGSLSAVAALGVAALVSIATLVTTAPAWRSAPATQATHCSAKRTFLVRHGRLRTCQLSAAAWSAGTVLLCTALPGHARAYTLCSAAGGHRHARGDRRRAGARHASPWTAHSTHRRHRPRRSPS
jgi:4-hydroxybenzoate polyprenyltransferase